MCLTALACFSSLLQSGQSYQFLIWKSKILYKLKTFLFYYGKTKKRIFKYQIWLKIGIIAHCATAWCTPKRFVLIFRFPTHKYTFHFAFFQTVSCSILKEIEVFVRNCDTSSFFASHIFPSTFLAVRQNSQEATLIFLTFKEIIDWKSWYCYIYWIFFRLETVIFFAYSRLHLNLLQKINLTKWLMIFRLKFKPQ